MADQYEAKRKAMVEYLVASGFLKTRVIIDAFLGVPRQDFVLEGYVDMAYEDTALPIMNGETISQPSTVAYSLELLQPKKGENILEIGSGSGYNACLLGKCVGLDGNVTTLEIDKDVARFAKSNVNAFEPGNVIVITADGSLGYPEEAPYDKIIYTAAAPEVPRQVIVQLKVGGRIVAPVGTKEMQRMKVVERISESKVSEKDYEYFQFVPLKGQLGF